MIRFLLFFFVINSSFAQEFEGLVRYGMSIEVSKENSISKKVLNRYKAKESDSSIVAYKKNGNFLKYNTSPKLINIYSSSTKLSYGIENGDKMISVNNPYYRANINRTSPIIKTSDSLFVINNIKCKKVHFDYKYYKTTIYYNNDEEYKDMSKIFFFGSLIDIGIRDSFQNTLIVRYIQEVNSMKTIVDLLELTKMTIDASIFKIPKFKRSSKYDYDENDKYNIYKIIDRKYQFPKLPLMTR